MSTPLTILAASVMATLVWNFSNQNTITLPQMGTIVDIDSKKYHIYYSEANNNLQPIIFIHGMGGQVYNR